MKKILIITGDAGEAQEIYYAKFRLEEEGWTVHIASPAKRVFASVVHDFEPGFDTYTEKPGYRVQADLAVDEVDAKEYDGLVLPGGRAPEYLRRNPAAMEVVRTFLESEKPIAANCHGPLMLFAAGWGKGRRQHATPTWTWMPGPRGPNSWINRLWFRDRWSRSGDGRTMGHGCGNLFDC